MWCVSGEGEEEEQEEEEAQVAGRSTVCFFPPHTIVQVQSQRIRAGRSGGGEASVRQPASQSPWFGRRLPLRHAIISVLKGIGINHALRSESL